MNATCGLTGKILSPSESLQSLLASRLQARTASAGSILYRLTWKDRVTPSGRAICALRASAARTFVSAYILSGWPTPCQQDGPNGGPAQGADRLPGCVPLAGWPTPHQNSTTGAGSQGRQGGLNIQSAVQLAGWGTPTSPVNTNGHQAGNNRYVSSVTDQTKTLQYAIRGKLTRDGRMLTGSSVEILTESQAGGPLSPEHSRWLMALPVEWANCAPTAMRSTRKPPRNSVRSSKKSAMVYDL